MILGEFGGTMTERLHPAITGAGQDGLEPALQTILDALPTMAFITDAEGAVLYANRLCRDYAGLSVEALAGEGWKPLVHPHDRERAETAWAAGLALGAPVEIEYRLRRADGAERWFRGRLAPQADSNGNVGSWLGTLSDIHDLKIAEAKAREAEAWRRLAQEASGVGTFDWNPITQELRWSAECKTVFGFPSEAEITDGLFLSRLHPEDRPLVVERIERAFDPAGSGEYRSQHRSLWPDGTIRWIEARGGVSFEEVDGQRRAVHFIGTVLDITEAKRIEETLARQRQELQMLTDALPVLISYIDADHRYQFVNKVYESWFPRRREEVIGRPVRDIIGEAAYALAAPHIDAALRGERIRFEQLMPYADTEPRHIEVEYVPRVGVDGNVEGIYGLVQDITARKASEAALQDINDVLEHRVANAITEREQAEEALRQAQKMEAIGQLTGGIAHDFNNLLTPIVGGLDVIRRRVTDERSQRLIEGALQSAERATTLVQRLLAFARRQTLQPRAVSAAGLLQGMQELIDRSLGPTIEVLVDVPVDLPPVLVDPNQLELALLNLAVNARDAMPEGGRLTISAQALPASDCRVPGLSPGTYVRLSVTDTGEGMDEATLKRAVEPFFSTKGTGKGTGLGLSMVHGLAAQLGGLFKLSSRVGEGTMAVLWLPVAETPAQSQISREDVAPGSSQPAMILVVDDEELVRQSVEEGLQELGYRVVPANSAEKALELVRAGLRPDALVTDHMMPGMSGAQLASELRRCLPGLPVLLITGLRLNPSPAQVRRACCPCQAVPPRRYGGAASGDADKGQHRRAAPNVCQCRLECRVRGIDVGHVRRSCPPGAYPN
ncbi:hypothetical protein Rumeso_02866 [Rubellimicrobium mesophilum DSM 19309]|uniref:histidine kinase n=1 Tax=Rubellimicrobium mesophilum DSM 19309 TaxID=442562 RepID=A0A017HMI5_9RHOB|nr:hypothetical protein Rumeso_02866 [Rubellimicrobium mesophilum DSM 19309]